VTALADRYTGRHIRQARHGAWVNKKRSRSKKPSTQLLPAAAAFTVAGILVGGASAAIHLHPVSGDQDLSVRLDPADLLPPDRNAQMDRSSRSEARPAGAEVNANAPLVPKQTVPVTTAETIIAAGTCQASYYEDGFRTASGEAFDPNGLTAANRDLPFNSLVRVTNQANGESVVVRINDRGGSYGNRCLDLSRGAFSTIADVGQGVVDVRYEVLAQDAT
jgi:peptidoglycan lytic transglycosylase